MRSITRKARGASTEVPGTVDNVVNTLEQLLNEGESFTTLSIDQLAKKSGIARATFYLHFRNKGELVSHLMLRVSKEMRQAATTSMLAMDNFGRADFLRFMKNAVEVNYQHRAAIRAIIETSSYDPEVAATYHTFMGKMIGDTRNLINRLKINGRAHPDVTLEVAEVLTWAAERCCDQMLKDEASPAQREHLAELLTHVVWNAIAATATESEVVSVAATKIKKAVVKKVPS